MKKLISVLMIVCTVMSVFFITPVNAMTVSEFNDKIAAQKSLYPHGSTWTSSFDGGSQCFGFAHMMAYNVFGTKAKTWSKVYSLNNVKAGDVVQFGNTTGSGHTVFVLSVSGDTVTYVDCNSDWNCTVKWGGTFSKSANKIWSYSFSYLYSAPDLETTPPKSIPQISSITGNGSDVTVSWNSVSDAEKYIVDFWNPNGSHNYFYTTGTSMTQSLPDAQYGIRVAAVNSMGEGNYTSFHYFWVSKSTVPQTPTITNIDVDGCDVTVTWNGTDITNSYTVDFWDTSGNHNYYKTSDTSITKTLQNSQYGIRINAENTAGSSNFSSFHYVYAGEYRVFFDVNGGVSEKTKARITYDSINGTRGANQLVIYTNSGASTGTNIYGIEVLVNENNQVIDIINRVGNATVPDNGFILSAHGEKHYWLGDNVSIGDYINYHPNTQEVWIWSENGWLTETKRVKIGKEYGKLPTPTKDGYIFDGWYTSAEGGEKVTEETTMAATEDHTLYAHWTPTPAHTSTTINDNLFTIECTNVENGSRVILALYKDKKFVKLYEEVYQGEDIQFTVTEAYDDAKVMVWKDLSTPKPVTAVETIK